MPCDTLSCSFNQLGGDLVGDDPTFLGRKILDEPATIMFSSGSTGKPKVDPSIGSDSQICVRG